MKNLNVRANYVLALLISGFAFTACTSNESTDLETQEFDATEVVLSAEIDEATALLDDVIIEVYEGEESNLSGRSANPESRPPHSLPDCVTITVVIEQGFREVTINFGSEGCVVRGQLLKGKIIMTYERDFEAQERLINYVLEDFYFNAKNIIGSKTILKQHANENGNPQFTHTLDLTVIWPDGTEASREGMKVREWVEGHGSGIFSDNVFEVTGYWTSNFVNGNMHRYEVIIPLRREVICRYFVSGSVDVEKTNYSGIFDYGEGDCDNQATFTFEDGTVRAITLN